MERRPGAVLELAELLLRVRDRAGQVRPLRANAAQRAFEARRGRQNIVLKARQMGITTWVAGRFFLRTITRPGTLTLQVAHTQAAAEAIFAGVERMWQELPEDLRAGQMVFPALDSEFRVSSAADANAGRGLSVQNLHCSEVSRWPRDAKATLAGLRAALTPEGELVLESTPHGAYGCFYEAWCGAADTPVHGPTLADGDAVGEEGAAGVYETQGHGQKQDLPLPQAQGQDDRLEAGTGEFADCGLVRHFLPWWMEPAYAGAAVPAERMTAEELALVARHGLSLAQIGFRRGLERGYGELRAQEFAEDAEICFRASGACCFDVEAIERSLAALGGAANSRNKDTPERRRGGALLVWLPPVAGREYLVAVDTAGGGAEGDFAAVQVVELGTGLQCAELQERLTPAELARVVAALGREYRTGCTDHGPERKQVSSPSQSAWPLRGEREGGLGGGRFRKEEGSEGEALVVVERNNHGAAVLAYLETAERYRKIYLQNGQAGWLTTAANKPEMVALLGVLLREAPERFQSRRLLGECRTFVSGERGATAAAAGAHDDLVMAMALGQAARAELMGV